MSHQKKGQKGKRNVEQERSFISTQFNAKCKTKHWKKVSKTFSKGNKQTNKNQQSHGENIMTTMH